MTFNIQPKVTTFNIYQHNFFENFFIENGKERIEAL